MMKLPKTDFFFRLAGLVSLFLFLSAPMEARIGESQESIERRLLASGGIVYRDDQVKSNRSRGLPYRKYLDFLPEETEVRIYFKSSDGRKPKSSDMEEGNMSSGWDIHVLYVRGKSVLEVYKRSQSMTDPELNLLLTLLGQGSYWKKVKPNPEDTESPPSAFGYTMLRSDGMVRGKSLGSDRLMVFDVAFDVGLAEMEIADDLERAPESVNGF